MVAIPAIEFTVLVTYIGLAIVALCLAYGLRVLLQQLVGPVSSIWPDAGAAIENAVSAITNWAINWANQLGGSVYPWIQAPANNAIVLLNGVHDFAYSLANALIRLHNRIGTVESTIGSWPNPASLANTVNYLYGQVSSLVASLNNVINFANALQTDLINDVNGLNGAITQAYNSAVAFTQNYVNNALDQVYGLLSQDVNALASRIDSVQSYAQAVDQQAIALASDAVSTSESYAYQAVGALEQTLVNYINSSVGGLRTELIDDVSRTTASLQASISGVSTSLKADVATTAANLAAADTALSNDLKQQLQSLASQLAQTTGAISDQLKADFAQATANIISVRDSLSNTLTADVTSLSNQIVQSEGALSQQLQGQIADVAAQAQAARNALQATLGASIASVAAQAILTARTLAADETNCIMPTCDAFLPLAPSAKAILSAATTGIFFAIIDAAITDPQGTASLFQPVTQAFAQPILSEMESLVPS